MKVLAYIDFINANYGSEDVVINTLTWKRMSKLILLYNAF